MLRRSVLVMMVCAPAVAHADEWSLHIVGAGTAGWTDNLFSAPEDPPVIVDPNGNPVEIPPVESDYYYQVHPGVLFSYEAQRMVHEVTYDLEANFYQEHSDARSLTHRVGWRGFFSTSPRSELSAGLAYSMGQVNALVARTTNAVPGGEVRFVAGEANEHYSYSITRQLRLTQTALARRNETKDDFNTNTTGMELGGSVGIDRSWTENAVGFTVSPTFVNLESRVTTQPPPEDPITTTNSLNVQATLSWRHDLSRYWSTLLDGGATTIVPLQDDQKTTIQPTVGAQISYAPEWGNAGVQVRRSVTPNLFIAQNTITDAATATVALPLPWISTDPQRPSWFVQVNGGVQRTQLIDLANDDVVDGFNVYLGDVAIGWTPRNAFAMSLRYQYVQQDAQAMLDTVTGMETFDYTRHSVIFMIGGRWPDRLAGEVPSRDSLRVDRSDPGSDIEEGGAGGDVDEGGGGTGSRTR